MNTTPGVNVTNLHFSLSLMLRVTRLGDFSPIGLLLEAHDDFEKDEIAQRNGNILGFFLLKQIYKIFPQIGNLKRGLLFIF
jgi:hypothetical protein